MKTSFLAALFVLANYFSITGQVPDSVKFKSLLPYDFHMAYLKEEVAILIDVREFFEFRGSRLREAVNIPSSVNLEFAADTLDKQSALFLYCTTGFRSKRVARYFYDQGFRKVYNLEGGIAEWKKDGFPVEKKSLRPQDTRRREEKK